MKSLYFASRTGALIDIKIDIIEEDVFRYIEEFCRERNYTIPYTRSWKTEDNELWFDVGSHTEFFVLK